mgnify:CR=1 FL=1
MVQIYSPVPGVSIKSKTAFDVFDTVTTAPETVVEEEAPAAEEEKVEKAPAKKKAAPKEAAAEEPAAEPEERRSRVAQATGRQRSR